MCGGRGAQPRRWTRGDLERARRLRGAGKTYRAIAEALNADRSTRARERGVDPDDKKAKLPLDCRKLTRDSVRIQLEHAGARD
jgi:hypothetical protein